MPRAAVSAWPPPPTWQAMPPHPSRPRLISPTDRRAFDLLFPCCQQPAARPTGPRDPPLDLHPLQLSPCTAPPQTRVLQPFTGAAAPLVPALPAGTYPPSPCTLLLEETPEAKGESPFCASTTGPMTHGRAILAPASRGPVPDPRRTPCCNRGAGWLWWRCQGLVTAVNHRPQVNGGYSPWRLGHGAGTVVGTDGGTSCHGKYSHVSGFTLPPRPLLGARVCQVSA